jgi:hypothetical protein
MLLLVGGMLQKGFFWFLVKKSIKIKYKNSKKSTPLSL